MTLHARTLVSPRKTPRKPRSLLLLTLFIVLLAPPLLPSAGAVAPPFALPFAGPPGPSTWYVTQWYGSTVWAYRNWRDQYSQGQGLHFGVDFAAPCGTPIHAIGDGVVFAVDGPYGAAPNNIVINHQNGYYSLYGHMFKRSTLQVGQQVKKGDVLGIEWRSNHPELRPIVPPAS